MLSFPHLLQTLRGRFAVLKKTVVLLGFVLLAGCGPSQSPPPDQNAAAPAAASSGATTEAPGVPPPSPTAAAMPPPAPAATPSADEQLAKIRAEQRKLQREQNALAAQQRALQVPPPPPPPPPCLDCGVISSIVPITQRGQPGLVGTLGGAAAGGLVGNQFGRGKGNTAMTVAGVIGGALAGRAVEEQVNSTTVFQITVDMQAGGQRVVTLNSAEGIGPGTRVRVYGNNLQPY
jgi:outer membrane lipoprotein SlyB